MPSKKTISILIVCLSIVLSVWIISSKDNVSIPKENIKQITTTDNSDKGYKNDDWKNLLATANTSYSDILDLTKKSNEEVDDTTLTAQLSKDFLAQYLLYKQNDQTLSTNEANNIIASIVSSKNYSEIKGPVYRPSNLKITNKSDVDTLKKYNYNITLIFNTRESQITTNPIDLVTTAAQTENSSAIPALKYMVRVGNSFIEDMMKIEVPIKAVDVHLEVMNAVSNLVADIEAMSKIDSDPVKSFVGMSQYSNDIEVFQNSIQKMSTYLKQN